MRIGDFRGHAIYRSDGPTGPRGGYTWEAFDARGDVVGQKGGGVNEPGVLLLCFAAWSEGRSPDGFAYTAEGAAAALDCPCGSLVVEPTRPEPKQSPPPPAAPGDDARARREAGRAGKRAAYAARQALAEAREAAERARRAETSAEAAAAAEVAEGAAWSAEEAAAVARGTEQEAETRRAAQKARRGAVKARVSAKVDAILEAERARDEERKRRKAKRDAARRAKRAEAAAAELARSAPPPPPARSTEAEDDAAVLAAVRAMTPDDMLRVTRVRPRVGIDKRRFDEAALRLFRRREISLLHHDAPEWLTPAEREELVLDPESGLYFNAVSARK